MRLLPALLLLLAVARPASAGLVLGLDYFTLSNAANGAKNAYPPAAATVSVKSIYGGRVGYLADVGPDTTMGPTFEYVQGPSFQTQYAGGGFTAEGDTKLSFKRLMLEFQSGTVHAAEFQTVFGAAVGKAWGRDQYRFFCSGSCPAVANHTEGWSGITWEASVGLARNGWMIGYRYAVLPSLHKPALLPKFDWSSNVLFVTVPY